MVAKTQQQLLSPCPALPWEKEGVDKCVKGCLGDCGLPPKEATRPSGRVESEAQWDTISQWIPHHSEEHSVYWRELFTPRSLCAFQKTAA